MKPLGLVFDTTFYIAATLSPDGYARAWLKRTATDWHYNIYVSPEILDEVEAKLRSKFGFTPADLATVRQELEAVAEVVHPRRRITAIKADPDDDKILECAVEANADLIISSDRHLYKLKRFESIQIKHTNTLKYIFPEQPGAA